MNIFEFVAKPTVTKLSISNEEFVKEFGDSLEFSIMLPMPVETYVTLTKLPQAEVVQKLLVDEEGKQLLVDGKTLPPALIMPVATRIWEELGKLPEKS